jgi:hypothetical protein
VGVGAGIRLIASVRLSSIAALIFAYFFIKENVREKNRIEIG